MSDTQAPRIARSPGLIGQSHPVSTIAATIVACIAGPALTCAIGSLVYLLDPGHHYLTETNLAGIDVSKVARVQSASRDAVSIFIFEWWTAIFAWVAVTAAVCSALVLNATFAIFRRADWSTVLTIYRSFPFVLLLLTLYIGGVDGGIGAFSDMTVRLLPLFGGAIIGVWQVYYYYSSYVSNAEFLTPPSGMPFADNSSQPIRMPQLWTQPAFRTRMVADQRTQRVVRDQVTWGVCYFVFGVSSAVWVPMSLGGPLAIHALVNAIFHALFYFELRRDPLRGNKVFVIDSQGITDDDVTIPWTEIGRTWTFTERNLEVVMVEASTAADARVRESQSWVRRFLLLGYSTLKTKHIGVTALDFSAPMTRATAEELRDAIELRRPPGTQYVTPGAPAG